MPEVRSFPYSVSRCTSYDETHTHPSSIRTRITCVALIGVLILGVPSVGASSGSKEIVHHIHPRCGVSLDGKSSCSPLDGTPTRKAHREIVRHIHPRCDVSLDGTSSCSQLGEIPTRKVYEDIVYHIRPGRVVSFDGKFSCSQSDGIATPKACGKVYDVLKRVLKDVGAIRQKFTSCINSNNPDCRQDSVGILKAETGFSLPFDEISRELHNHALLLTALYALLVPQKLQRSSPEALLNRLIDVNANFFDGLTTAPYPKGLRRTSSLIVDLEGKESPGRAIEANLIPLGYLDEDVDRVVSAFYHLMDSKGVYPEKLKKLPKAERNILKHLVSFPLPPLEIKGAMLEFLDQLKSRVVGIKDKNQAVDLAAWAHQEIVRIHPFSDGNGLLARGVMNMILLHQGINFVAFPSEKIYKNAAKGMGNYLPFKKTLLEIINNRD